MTISSCSFFLIILFFNVSLCDVILKAPLLLDNLPSSHLFNVSTDSSWITGQSLEELPLYQVTVQGVVPQSSVSADEITVLTFCVNAESTLVSAGTEPQQPLPELFVSSRVQLEPARDDVVVPHKTLDYRPVLFAFRENDYNSSASATRRCISIALNNGDSGPWHLSLVWARQDVGGEAPWRSNAAADLNGVATFRLLTYVNQIAKALVTPLLMDEAAGEGADETSLNRRFACTFDSQSLRQSLKPADGSDQNIAHLLWSACELPLDESRREGIDFHGSALRFQGGTSSPARLSFLYSAAAPVTLQDYASSSLFWLANSILADEEQHLFLAPLQGLPLEETSLGSSSNSFTLTVEQMQCRQIGRMDELDEHTCEDALKAVRRTTSSASTLFVAFDPEVTAAAAVVPNNDTNTEEYWPPLSAGPLSYSLAPVLSSECLQALVRLACVGPRRFPLCQPNLDESPPAPGTPSSQVFSGSLTGVCAQTCADVHERCASAHIDWIYRWPCVRESTHMSADRASFDLFARSLLPPSSNVSQTESYPRPATECGNPVTDTVPPAQLSEAPTPAPAPTLAPLPPFPVSCASRASSAGTEDDAYPRCFEQPSIDQGNTRCFSGSAPPQPRQEMPVNLTIAFFGDQSVGPRPRLLLEQLRSVDGVDAFIHAGDFDYIDNPEAFASQIDEVLGPDFPYFVAVGNHDLPFWKDYSRLAYNRLERMNATCIGDVGRDMICSFHGFTFVLSGVGSSATFGASYIRPALERFGGVWRACIWHKNQRLTQIGGKPDEVGFDAFNDCVASGAFIVNGHEHSYARSQSILHYENPALQFLPNTTGADAERPMQLRRGLSFVATVGTAGKPIRYCQGGLENNPWWAKTLCAPGFAEAGGLVCKFNLNGEADLAFCYFRSHLGHVLDSFYVHSSMTAAPTFPCDGETPADAPLQTSFEWPQPQLPLTACEAQGCWTDRSLYSSNNLVNSWSWCGCCAMDCMEENSACVDACRRPSCQSHPACVKWLEAHPPTPRPTTVIPPPTPSPPTVSPVASGQSITSSSESTKATSASSEESAISPGSTNAASLTDGDRLLSPSDKDVGIGPGGTIIIFVFVLLLTGAGVWYYLRLRKRGRRRSDRQFMRFDLDDSSTIALEVDDTDDEFDDL